jgi:hypothetical protein
VICAKNVTDHGHRAIPPRLRADPAVRQSALDGRGARYASNASSGPYARGCRWSAAARLRLWVLSSAAPPIRCNTCARRPQPVVPCSGWFPHMGVGAKGDLGGPRMVRMAAKPDVVLRDASGAVVATLELKSKRARPGPDLVLWSMPRAAVFFLHQSTRRHVSRHKTIPSRPSRSRAVRTRSRRSPASTRARAPDDGGGGDADPDDAEPRRHVGEQERGDQDQVAARRGRSTSAGGRP